LGEGCECIISRTAISLLAFGRWVAINKKRAIVQKNK
jgi:hypothetical protein